MVGQMLLSKMQTFCVSIRLAGSVCTGSALGLTYHQEQAMRTAPQERRSRWLRWTASLSLAHVLQDDCKGPNRHEPQCYSPCPLPLWWGLWGASSTATHVSQGMYCQLYNSIGKAGWVSPLGVSWVANQFSFRFLSPFFWDA